MTKTFKGLTKDQIRELAETNNPYTITLIPTETNTPKTLTMDASELDNILQGSDDEKYGHTLGNRKIVWMAHTKSAKVITVKKDTM